MSLTDALITTLRWLFNPPPEPGPPVCYHCATRERYPCHAHCWDCRDHRCAPEDRHD